MRRLIEAITDRVALAYVRRRTAWCHCSGDHADLFGDKLIKILSGEIARRQAKTDRAESRRRKLFKIS